MHSGESRHLVRGCVSKSDLKFRNNCAVTGERKLTFTEYHCVLVHLHGLLELTLTTYYFPFTNDRMESLRRYVT